MQRFLSLLCAGLCIFSAVRAHATVEVAFFELHDADGKLIQLEPGGRFGHVAIEVGHRWLEAHPYYGVILVNSLAEIGNGPVVLVNDDLPDLSEDDVARWIGLPFDPKYRWEDPNSTYCSKLVAQILNVSPVPAKFEGPYWEKQHFHPKPGAVGVSPDRLYKVLLQRGYSI